MDDYRFSSAYDSGWKSIRNPPSEDKIRSMEQLLELHQKLPPILKEPEETETIDLPDPRDIFREMQDELMTKLNQIQMEINSLRQMYKENLSANMDREAFKPNANKPSRFFK